MVRGQRGVLRPLGTSQRELALPRRPLGSRASPFPGWPPKGHLIMEQLLSFMRLAGLPLPSLFTGPPPVSYCLLQCLR